MKIVKLFIIVVATIQVVFLSACSNQDVMENYRTIDEVIQNIELAEMEVMISDIAQNLHSSIAERQVKIEFTENGDQVYLYQYASNKKMNEEDTDLHNLVNTLYADADVLFVGGSNLYAIYVKAKTDDYEAEGRVLSLLSQT